MFKRIFSRFIFNNSVYKFWVIMVLLNAVFGLFMGLDVAKSFGGDMGIICGVVTFMLIYIKMDIRLRNFISLI